MTAVAVGTGIAPRPYRDPSLPVGADHLLLLEAKASKTIRPGMAQPLDRLARSIARYRVTKAIVHMADSPEALTIVHPGTQAVSIRALARLLEKHR